MDQVVFENKKVLVTGGNGYLGSHLIRKLLDKGADVHTIDISEYCPIESVKYYQVDLRDQVKLSQIIIQIKPSVIFHLAATLSRTRDFEEASSIFEINLMGTINLLNALKNIEYDNFIFTSTSEVYGGNGVNAPFKEDMHVVPASPYSLSKFCAETTIKTFSDIYNKNYTVLRLFNFFGKGMSNQFFLPQLIEKLKNNQSFDMTAGVQLRDYLYIDDVLQALIQSVNTEAYNQVFNVCSGVGVSIKALALDIKSILKSNSHINFGAIPYRQNEVWEMIGNNNKIKNALGFSPLFQLHQGLEKIININE